MHDKRKAELVESIKIRLLLMVRASSLIASQTLLLAVDLFQLAHHMADAIRDKTSEHWPPHSLLCDCRRCSPKYKLIKES